MTSEMRALFSAKWAAISVLVAGTIFLACAILVLLLVAPSSPWLAVVLLIVATLFGGLFAMRLVSRSTEAPKGLRPGYGAVGACAGFLAGLCIHMIAGTIFGSVLTELHRVILFIALTVGGAFFGASQAMRLGRKGIPILMVSAAVLAIASIVVSAWF